MLHTTRYLLGMRIHATDGDLGKIEDLFFDDQKWVVRHLVVDTGHWLPGRKVLISPIAVHQIHWAEGRIDLNLSRGQIRSSPDVDTEMPVSREHELELYRYYNWPLYWSGSGLWGVGDFPRPISPVSSTAAGGVSAHVITPEGEEEHPHLRSLREIRDYRIHAIDGEFGHLDGLIIDERTWAVRYVVVDTKNWWPSRPVLIAPQWIQRVSWGDHRVEVGLRIGTIKHAPPYDPGLPITEEYEQRLYDYYRLPRVG